MVFKCQITCIEKRISQSYFQRYNPHNLELYSLSMVRLLSFVVAAFIFSCTIIEDGDITSQEELDNLKLLSIDIEQQASVGTSSSVARVTSDRVVNIPVAGGVVTRQIWMEWPALGVNSKLKVKSGATTTFRSYASFLEGGKPWTFYLFSSGTDSTILELYSFRYNASGRLASVTTRAPYVNGGPATTYDTLIYDNGGWVLNSGGFIRKYPGTSNTATLTNLNYHTSGNSYYLNDYQFQGIKYQKRCQGGSECPNWGGDYHVMSNGFPVGVMNLATFKKEYLDLQDVNTIEQKCQNNNPCSFWIDTFYLHPLLILKDQFDHGDDLLLIYMIDWWKYTTTTPSTTNEKVTIRFNYDI